MYKVVPRFTDLVTVRREGMTCCFFDAIVNTRAKIWNSLLGPQMMGC